MDEKTGNRERGREKLEEIARAIDEIDEEEDAARSVSFSRGEGSAP